MLWNLFLFSAKGSIPTLFFHFQLGNHSEWCQKSLVSIRFSTKMLTYNHGLPYTMNRDLKQYLPSPLVSLYLITQPRVTRKKASWKGIYGEENDCQENWDPLSWKFEVGIVYTKIYCECQHGGRSRKYQGLSQGI